MIEQYLTSDNIQLALAGLAAFLAGKYMWKGDTKVEKRRRAAAELAGQYREKGFITIPDILLDYSVGDYSGIAKRIYSVYGHAKDNGLEAEFETVFEKMLAAKMQDPEAKAVLKERLEK